jgi:hypothetical protein
MAKTIMENEQIDKNTFGGTRAAEVLVAMINEIEDKNEASKILRKVSKSYHRYTQGVREICSNIEDRKIRDLLLNLWHENATNLLNSSDIPEKIKSYTANIESFLYRKMKRLMREKDRLAKIK